VSLQAVLNGSNDIAFENVIGSIVANITLVLGLTALIFRLKISEKNSNFKLSFFIIFLFMKLFFSI
jgi:cation:H+ antiporter